LEQQPAGLAERFQVLRRHWRLVVIAAAVVTLVAVVYSLREGTTYSASSRVLIRPVLIGGTSTAQDRFGVVIDPFGLTAPIDTQAQLLLGEEVARHVRARFPQAGSELVTLEGEPVTDDILEIGTTSPSPQVAVRMANAYATAFLDMRRDVVRRGLEGAVADLEQSLETLEDRRETLRSSLAAPPVGSDPDDITAELERVREHITEITAQRDDLLIDLDSISGGGAVLLRAASALSSEPATLRDGIVALLLGLMLGIGLALLRGSVDRRLYSPQDVVDATDTQILAAIPRGARGRAARSGITVTSRSEQRTSKRAANPLDEGVELRLPAATASALAAVRASLVSHGLGSRYRTVTLLSPEPGQGSAVASGGIGWACATFGLRTIVVDAAGLDESDRVLSVSATRGLFQVLTGSARLTDVLVPTSIRDLRLLPPGPSGDHALDLLSANDPKLLTEQLRQNADVVVVRSPAVSSGGDAVTWMSVSDAVVLVVRAGACKPVMAERAAQVARSLEIPLLGTILVDADPHHGTVDVAAFSRRTGWATPDGARGGNGGKPGTTPAKPGTSLSTSSATRPEREKERDVRTTRRRGW
jgi:capsular polysaccharide biosynthesis protein/Mrp family chromosome partitioning ATPase